MATTKKDLSTKDVCDIIEACAQSQVVSLSWGDLSVSFSPPGRREEDPPPPGQVTQPPLSTEQHETQTAQAIEQEAIRLRENQLAMAAIENPAAFEEMVQGEDLDDDDDDGSEEH